MEFVQPSISVKVSFSFTFEFEIIKQKKKEQFNFISYSLDIKNLLANKGLLFVKNC